MTRADDKGCEYTFGESHEDYGLNYHPVTGALYECDAVENSELFQYLYFNYYNIDSMLGKSNN
jgi:hypothetical protein